jgi:hypothetical protein
MRQKGEAMVRLQVREGLHISHTIRCASAARSMANLPFARA